MGNLDRKFTILLHIKNYCEEVKETLKFFGTQFETFENNYMFRNTISMSIQQIGELAKILDKDYKEYINETEENVPWKDIIRMRDRFAHHYGEMDRKIIFDTAINDIPVLDKFLKDEIKRLYDIEIDKKDNNY